MMSSRNSMVLYPRVKRVGEQTLAACLVGALFLTVNFPFKNLSNSMGIQCSVCFVGTLEIHAILQTFVRSTWIKDLLFLKNPSLPGLTAVSTVFQ